VASAGPYTNLHFTPAVIPAYSQKNTGHFAGHLRKKYRTFYRTSEKVNFARLVRNYCISAVFYK